MPGGEELGQALLYSLHLENLKLEGKKILVVGLARSGEAAASFLLSRGAQVVVTDSADRDDPEIAERKERLELLARRLGARLEFELGGHRIDSFVSSNLIVVSPGVPLTIEPLQRARAAGVEIIGELELAARYLKGKIVAITGSNGKTTTAALTGELLRAAGLRSRVAGNIGLPLVGFVDASRQDDFYVVEVSSFQLETIRLFRPYVAVLLNITPDHLDRYPSFEAYARAKQEIFRNQTEADWAVLNADDRLVASFGPQARARKLYFSRSRKLESGVYVDRGRIWYRDGEELELMRLEEIPLRGAHNRENVCAALAAGLLCGADPEAMRRAVRSFKGVEHRLEFVAEIDGVGYYNDSKATNVDAALKALEAFDGNIVLILGGKDKGGDFSAMRELVAARVKHLLLIGAAREAIAAALGEVVPSSFCSSLEEAVERAHELARAGDVVLLAPACASFDMFRNYEHRGEVFKKAVLALTGK